MKFIKIIFLFLSLTNNVHSQDSISEIIILGDLEKVQFFFDTLKIHKESEIIIISPVQYYYLELLKRPNFNSIDTFDLQSPKFYHFTRHLLANPNINSNVFGVLSPTMIQVYFNLVLDLETKNNILELLKKHSKCEIQDTTDNLIPHCLTKVSDNYFNDSTINSLSDILIKHLEKADVDIFKDLAHQIKDYKKLCQGLKTIYTYEHTYDEYINKEIGHYYIFKNKNEKKYNRFLRKKLHLNRKTINKIEFIEFENGKIIRMQ